MPLHFTESEIWAVMVAVEWPKQKSHRKQVQGHSSVRKREEMVPLATYLCPNQERMFTVKNCEQLINR